jgi:diguanylate cyclase (GGDEF)-like protein
MPNRAAPFHLAIPLAVAVGAGATLWGHTRSDAIQTEVAALRLEAEQATLFKLAVVRADAAVRGYLLYGQPGFLEEAHRQFHVLERPATAATVAAIDRTRAAADEERLADSLADWIAKRRRGLALITAGEGARVLEAGREGRGQEHTQRVLGAADRFVASAEARLAQRRAALAQAGQVVLWLVVASALLSLLALFATWRQLRERARVEGEARAALATSTAELGRLREVSELLQACETADEVAQVAGRAVERLLPGTGAALLLLPDAEAEALVPGGAWGVAVPESVSRCDCWALKRGRAHAADAAASCAPCQAAGASLCVPLAARGESLGVLWSGGAPLDRPARKLATTLADQLALALADIRLREELRAQALRDGLTGLNNRRFLDEVGDKLCQQTVRRGGQLAVIMLDIDHFKVLNDEHGHAAGDAALRRTGQVIAEGLRRSDICCRYGGEEFALILPDCSTENAAMRAEHLRRRIEREPDARGVPAVTASFGVAALPASGTTMRELLRAADEALYRAKAGGRNRVETATIAGAPVLRLAGTEADARAPQARAEAVAG